MSDRLQPHQLDADLVVVGAGAAGLMAAVWAARGAPRARVLVLDGARKPGAKILVAGGGRCNVTHAVVDERDFNGGSPNTIRRVLRAWPVSATVTFFEELGVALKREDTGKLFPVSDSARDVLGAFHRELARLGVALHPRHRVETIEDVAGGFHLSGAWGSCRARRVILATGGKSLPKSGSDGSGYALARALGHSVPGPLLPALVPLVLARGHVLRELSGVATPARLTVKAGSGKRLATACGDVLCTHFGLSGPAALDISRHWLTASRADAGAGLYADWLPDASAEDVDRRLQEGGRKGVRGLVRQWLPQRLADTLCELAGILPEATCAELSRTLRRALVQALTDMPLPVVGDRGFQYAEVTAGGVPLDEVDPRTMHSRRCAGLYLVGEILDVDGRIGGFNFQWAWASGYLAGQAAAAALVEAYEQ